MVCQLSMLVTLTKRLHANGRCTAEQIEAHNGGIYQMLLCRVALGNPRVVTYLEWLKVDKTKRDFTSRVTGCDAAREGWGGPHASGLNAVPDVPSPQDLAESELQTVLRALKSTAPCATPAAIREAISQGKLAMATLLEQIEEQWRGQFSLPHQVATQQYDTLLSEGHDAAGIFKLREFVIFDAHQTYPEFVLHFRRRVSEGVPPH